MKFATTLAAVSLVAPFFTVAHPMDTRNLQQKMAHLDERYTEIVVTSGVAGSTYPRLEIRQMLSDEPNQFTLFILAMQQWQAQSESSATSFYGVSSIHGVPLMDYNNVAQCADCGDSYGYCAHGMVLFPAWHRAYLALFEQEFMQVVNQVAASFTGSSAATMQAAAATMRFPYWDWAANPASGLPVIPKVVTDQYITVKGPKGSQTIQNPLFRSNIDNPSNMVYADFINYKVTYRYPTTGDASATSQENKIIAAFNQQNANLRSSVYQLMTACTEYLPFSNTGDSGSESCTTSLEGIHNTVHQLAGGGQAANGVVGGNMYNLPVASYDPVFWLHHAMVDRLFAFWQTLHPDSYGASQQVSGSTWTVANNTVQDADSPLTPFYKDNNGNFWTTNEVRDWDQTFHYTYPEYVNSDGSAAAIASYVNKLYGPSATATAGSTKSTQTAASSAASVSSSSVKSSSASTVSSHASTVSTHTSTVSSHASTLSSHVSTVSATASAVSSSLASSKASLSSSALSTFATATSAASSLITAAPNPTPVSVSNPMGNIISAAEGAFGSAISTAEGIIGGVMGSVGNVVSTLGQDTEDLLTNNNTMYQYFANVKAPVNAMNGSYIIYVFHGLPTNEQPQAWPFDKNLIGSVPMLVTPGMAMGDALRSAGAVPLTNTLATVVTSGLLGGLDEPLVIPYLQSNLHWRVLGAHGESADPSSIKGLMVSVSSATQSAISSIHELPKVSGFKLLPEVTAQKPGGLKAAVSWTASTVSGVLSSVVEPPSPPAACPAHY